MMITVDYAIPYTLSDEYCGNELSTLQCLSVGLRALAFQVHRLELSFQEKERSENSRIGFSGNRGGLSPDLVAILPCFFHWFGVSVCNYARLVGFLGGLAQGTFSRGALEDPASFKLIKEHCSDYINSIPQLKPVLAWRNKIAAHFAITDPRNDNPAFLDFSVMYPVSYMDSRFRVNVMTLQRTDAQGVLHTGSMEPWSVTEVFEALTARYWPVQDNQFRPPRD